MDGKSRPLDEFTQNAQALTRAKFHKKEDGHMILEPHDFKSIDPATFSALKERYPIYNTLPRGPIPGNLEPLAKGLGPRAFKEQFEDTWASTNLAYAAAVRTYVQLEQLKEDKKPPSKKKCYKTPLSPYSQYPIYKHGRYNNINIIVPELSRPTQSSLEQTGPPSRPILKRKPYSPRHNWTRN
ncbi:hypothetical protein AAMO2058_000638900 [Amorphochlora amoebiformis]